MPNKLHFLWSFSGCEIAIKVLNSTLHSSNILIRPSLDSVFTVQIQKTLDRKSGQLMPNYNCSDLLLSFRTFGSIYLEIFQKCSYAYHCAPQIKWSWIRLKGTPTLKKHMNEPLFFKGCLYVFPNGLIFWHLSKKCIFRNKNNFPWEECKCTMLGK